MRQKFLLLLMALLAGVSLVRSQNPTLSPQVTPTQGDYFINGPSLSWTMGETFTPTLIAGSNMLSQGFEQPEIQITTGIVSSPLCPGGSVNIPFTADGYVDVANVYTAQLSDASGSFASPVVLGTLTSTAISGTINGTIPVITAAGTGYLVRVAGSAPVFNGISTVTAVTINPQPVFTASPTDVTCNGNNNGQIDITVTTGTAPFTYSVNNGVSFPYSASPVTGLAPNTYNVLVTDNNGCISAASPVTINQPTVLTASASSGTPYAEGQTINLSSSGGGGTPVYSYSWSGPLTFTSTSQNPSITNASPGMSGTYSVTVTDGNGCTATASTAVFVSSSGVNIWIGTTTNWFTPGNWTANAVPASCGDTIIIPSGRPNYPVLTANATVGPVTLQQGVNINQQTYSLSICGYLAGPAGAAASILGTGTTILNGTLVQNISGIITIPELELNNAAGASFTSTAKVNIATALDLKSGNLNVTNGSLTLLSTSVTQVAIIDNFSAGNSGSLTGTINSERYYASSGTYNQHLMGSPVNNPSFAQLGAIGHDIGGYVVPKADCDEANMSLFSPYGHVFSYHENAPGASACGEAQWYVEKAGNAINGLGYSVVAIGSGTFTLSGQANLNSTYTLNAMSNSNWANTSLQGRNMSGGWQLVSNPYQATLQINTTNTGFDNQIQVWNCNGSFAGTYQPGNIGSDAIVAPFQAFMVHVTNPGAGNTYTIKASDRVRTAAQFYAQHDNELDILAQNEQTGLLDQTVVAFDSRATDGFDPQFDADKFGGALNRHTLYSLNNNKWMARNVLNSINTNSTVPVGFEPGVTGNYKFTFGNLNTFDPTTYIYLEDKHTGTMYNVRNGNYQFSADSADEWNRFVLHFTPPASILTVKAGCNTPGSITVIQPGTANWNYTLTDAGSAIIASGILNQSAPVNVANLGAGNYTLNLVDNNGYAVTKIIEIDGASDLSAAFTLPASATVQSGVAFVSTSQNAVSYTWYISNGVTISGASPTYKFTEPGTYTVMLVVTSAAGCTSSVQKSITINQPTGLSEIAVNGGITLWSYENRVYVDFTQITGVNAVIKIYDILGREISNDKFVSPAVYQKEINNMEAAYIIVSVRNEDKMVTRKLFIFNTK